MQENQDMIQSCIDHIKTAVDVDAWAAELAEKALRHYGKKAVWEKSKKYKGMYRCSACHNCYIAPEWVYEDKWCYCPACGAIMEKPKGE